MSVLSGRRWHASRKTPEAFSCREMCSNLRKAERAAPAAIVVISPTERSDVNAEAGSHVRDGFAALCSDCFSLVVCLFGWCRPSTITRLIVPVDVDPVERVTGRAWSHVFIEREKIVQPARANGNATASVVVVLSDTDVVAPRFSPMQRLILASSDRAASGLERLTAHASTARGMSAPEISTEGDGFSSAFTAALPSSEAVPRDFARQHDQAPEPEAYQILKWWHLGTFNCTAGMDG